MVFFICTVTFYYLAERPFNQCTWKKTVFPTQMCILIILAILNLFAVLQLWEIQHMLGILQSYTPPPAVFIPFLA